MNKFIQYVVMAAVGVLLLTSLLFPTISDAQNTVTEVTMSNAGLNSLGEGSYYDEDVTLKWEILGESITDSKFYVNDEEAIISNIATVIPIAIGYEFMAFAHNYDASNTVTLLCVYTDETGTHSTQRYTTSGDILIEYSKTNGTITLTVGDTVVVTAESNYFFGKAVDGKGDYNLITRGDFVNAVISQNAINANSGGVIAVWLANITVNGDSYAVRAVSDINGTYGIGTLNGETSELPVELEINGLTPVANSTDLYTGGIPSLKWTVDGETATTVTSASYVIKEVAGHQITPANNPIYSILGLIPILLVCGLIAGIVGIVAVRRGA